MKQEVEREIPIPKPYTQTLEVVKQVRVMRCYELDFGTVEAFSEKVSVPTNESGAVLAQSSAAPQTAQVASVPPAVVHAPSVSRTYALPAVPSTGPGSAAQLEITRSS